MKKKTILIQYNFSGVEATLIVAVVAQMDRICRALQLSSRKSTKMPSEPQQQRTRLSTGQKLKIVEVANLRCEGSHTALYTEEACSR
jgi:hypothetical protein